MRILDGIIEEHLEKMGNGGGGEVEDLLDVLLKVQQDGDLPIPLDMDVIKLAILVSNLKLISNVLNSRLRHLDLSMSKIGYIPFKVLNLPL